MDAFVYRTSDGDAGHIGMLYSEGTGGSDYIIESRGDSYGTGIWYQDYRSSSAFRAVMREGWTRSATPGARRHEVAHRHLVRLGG